MGPGRMGIHHHEQEPPFPVGDSPLFLSITHPLIFFLVLCMLDIKRVSL
jgi:hypothetical protein